MSFTPIDPPPGVSRAVFRGVIGAAQIAYLATNKDGGKKELPTIQEIKKYCKSPEKKIAEVVNSNEFKKAMRERGVFWDTKDGLSPEQVYAIGIIVNPSDKRDLQGKLKAAGITYQTYRSWLRTPAFSDAIRRVGENLLTDHLSDVHTALTANAINGSQKAIELYYQINGRFDPQKQAIQDLNRMVSLLLEVIFRHVQDTSVLARINSDFERVISGEEIAPELIVDGQVIPERRAIEPTQVVIPDASEDTPPEELDSALPDLPPGFFDFQPEDQ